MYYIDKCIQKEALDYSQLSIPSKRFLSYSNPIGFRLLLPQTTLSNKCIPFLDFFVKKEEELKRLEILKHQRIEKLINDGRLDKRKEIENQIKQTREELQNSSNDWDKDYHVSTLNYLESKLLNIQKGEVGFVREFDKNDKVLQEIEHSIANLKSNNEITPPSANISEMKQCGCCGIVLPKAHIEEHFDFILKKAISVCPLCHYVEHLDNAAEVNAGYITYLPMLTQEQINLFSYCYFVFKYMNEELRKSDSENIRTQVETLNKSLINEKLPEFTFLTLYKEMQSFRDVMKEESNKLVEFFKIRADIKTEELFLEYEKTKNIPLTDPNEDINNRLKSFIVNQFDKYNENNKIDFKSQRFFSFNLDNMNLPAFYASLLIKEQINSNSSLTTEEIINKLTRLEGIRFLPSYKFFKPFIKKWTPLFINKEMINGLISFVENNINFTNIDDSKKDDEGQTEEENQNQQAVTNENQDEYVEDVEECSMDESDVDESHQDEPNTQSPEYEADESEISLTESSNNDEEDNGIVSL